MEAIIVVTQQLDNKQRNHQLKIRFLHGKHTKKVTNNQIDKQKFHWHDQGKSLLRSPWNIFSSLEHHGTLFIY